MTIVLCYQRFSEGIIYIDCYQINMLPYKTEFVNLYYRFKYMIFTQIKTNSGNIMETENRNII